jgi:hypothetical protein
VPGTSKRAEAKLGNYPDLSLDDARRECDRRRNGAKTAHARHMAPSMPKLDRGMTVKVVAELWIDNRKNTGRWKSRTYPSSVRQRLKDYVYAIIGHQPIAIVNHEMICEVLSQAGGKDDPRTLWLRHPTLADMVRRILADVIDFAAAKGYRSRELANPASWDRLQHLYPAVADIHTTRHFAAIEPEDAPALMAKIRADRLIPAKALALVLYTGVRLSDVFGGGREHSEPLKWKHLDEEKRNWHVPMTKKNKGLTVPLSDQAFAVIAEMRQLAGGAPSPEAKVFPRDKGTLRHTLVRLGMEGKQTVHGCRALFDTWARNIDDDREPLKGNLIDAALCHKLELPAPLEVIPHPDSETVTFMAGKLVLDGSEVRVNMKRPAGIKVPNTPGRTDQWDWDEARVYLRNFYLRAVAGGDDPDLVAELRVFFQKKHGTDEHGNDIVPSDRSLREHVQEWRGKGDYVRFLQI